MSREVRRVALGFDWPLGKVWGGYIMPERLIEAPCDACTYDHTSGTGYSPEANAIGETFYPHQIGSRYGRDHEDRLAWHNKIGQKEVDYLVKHGRLGVWVDGKWTHPPRLAQDVNRENDKGGISGHDAINRGLLIRFRCKRLGIPLLCAVCKGHGTVETHEGQRSEADAWTPLDPPAGDGWQVWETVSEGSPVTPVFETAEGLAAWLSIHPRDLGPSLGDLTYTAALTWVTGDAWMPSGIGSSSGFLSGADLISNGADHV